ncbi:MAG: sigma-70 family RNA polymerase sigma factor [Parcubacteria group bacterium]
MDKITEEKNDKQLIEKFLAGDGQSFEFLLKKYLKPVYNFLYRLTSDTAALDDLTQTTFIKAWQNIKKFNLDKNFKTWIFTIAKNTAYDYFKKKKTVPFANFIDAEGNNKLENISDGDILPLELLAKADAAKTLETALAKISDQYHLILTMHYKNDLTLREIAEILSLPYNTVKSQHQRGLKALRQILQEM